jgi:single-stranded-DNA-specific exonuclease
METKLIDFLQGQQIFVWDLKRTKQILDSLFGSGADFQMFDLSQEVAKKIPSMANMTLQNLRSKSKLARYNDEFDSEIKGFFNIFVTFVTMQLAAQYPKDASDDELDLQLVSLAALADIMPLTDENRILVTRGIAAMNNGKPRNGLIELLSLQELLGKRVNSIDLSWSIIPALNSTGRLGQPEVGLDLFLEKTAEKRMKLAKKIVEMNNERKRLGQEAYDYGLPKSKESVEKYGGKLCVVIDERINRGVSGILASKLVSFYNIPSMAITFVDDTAIGSMRSCRGFDATIFLDKMSDIFISHGGHNYAAGFSFKKENLPKFLSYLDQLYTNIQLDEPSTDTFEVDAELPPDFLTPNILKLVDKLEPYGESNRELLFMSRTLKITDYDIVGKVSKKQHLKLTLDCGKSKWPAIFWGGADYIHNEFEKGDFVDILYKINRNTFNGLETPQMIITDIRKSQK